MNEKEVTNSILNISDIIYDDVKRLTTGNIAHLKPGILHDINALKHNIYILIRDNTDLSDSIWKLKD